MSTSNASPAQPAQDAVIAEIRIAAPPARVFQALVDPSQVVQWWGQAGIYRCTKFESELRVGGMWRSMGVDGNGRPFEIVGEYLEVDPPRAISSTWACDLDGRCGDENTMGTRTYKRRDASANLSQRLCGTS